MTNYAENHANNKNLVQIVGTGNPKKLSCNSYVIHTLSEVLFLAS